MSQSIFAKLLSPSRGPKSPRRQPRPRTEADLINAESRLGRTIFGPVAEDYPREFFHHQKNVWIWYENGVTTRYKIRQRGVFKKITGSNYVQITGQELENFRTAVKTYYQLVKSQLYTSN